jgi:hypothetical protein
MDLYELLLRPERGSAKSKRKSKNFRLGRALAHERQFGDFDCCRCRLRVSAEQLLSGVHNRNHCPYCLWSKHVDLREAGDRLAACKSPMQPAGLTFKRVHKKYAPAGLAGGAQPGELMLVHHCAACGALSLNRVAADDSPDRLWEVFETSLAQPPAPTAGIDLLGIPERGLVRARVFG